MDGRRLDDLLERLRDLSVAVIGDFCVDRYLHVDPGIRDDSRETGLPIHQVVDTRNLPGGAGAVLAAGADLIAPDFLEADALLDYLFTR